MQYVIEYRRDPDREETILSGPFKDIDVAVSWAVDHAPLPWTLRSLNVIPPKDARTV